MVDEGDCGGDETEEAGAFVVVGVGAPVDPTGVGAKVVDDDDDDGVEVEGDVIDEGVGAPVDPTGVGAKVVDDDDGVEVEGDVKDEGVGAPVDPALVGRVVDDARVGAPVVDGEPKPPVVGAPVVDGEPEPPVVGAPVVDGEPAVVGDLVVEDVGAAVGTDGMDIEGDEFGVVAGAVVSDVLGAEPAKVIFLTVE